MAVYVREPRGKQGRASDSPFEGTKPKNRGPQEFIRLLVASHCDLSKSNTPASRPAPRTSRFPRVINCLMLYHAVPSSYSTPQ